MDGDLTSRNMNNGEGSNRDNPRSGNLKVSHKENLRLDSPNSNNLDHRFSNPRNGNPNNSLLNLGASNTREDHSAHSLKENLKDGMQSIESRMTGSLKTLSSIISAEDFHILI
jgi:hypothetical protein